MQDVWKLACGLCKREFLVCVPCGRTRRYCGDGCASAASRESRRRARRKQQSTYEGRLDHRDRQRQYRSRRRSCVTDKSVGSLTESGSLYVFDAKLGDDHGQGEQRRDTGSGQAGSGRADDRSPGPSDERAPAGTSVTDGGAGSLVSVPDLRCSVCGKRGGRLVDRPCRWPWVRPRHAALRSRGCTSNRSSPRRSAPGTGSSPRAAP